MYFLSLARSLARARALSLSVCVCARARACMRACVSVLLDEKTERGARGEGGGRERENGKYLRRCNGGHAAEEIENAVLVPVMLVHALNHLRVCAYGWVGECGRLGGLVGERLVRALNYYLRMHV